MQQSRLFYGWLLVFVSVLGAAFSPAALVNIPFVFYARYFGPGCFGQIYATLLASYLIGAAA